MAEEELDIEEKIARANEEDYSSSSHASRSSSSSDDSSSEVVTGGPVDFSKQFDESALDLSLESEEEAAPSATPKQPQAEASARGQDNDDEDGIAQLTELINWEYRGSETGGFNAGIPKAAVRPWIAVEEPLHRRLRVGLQVPGQLRLCRARQTRKETFVLTADATFVAYVEAAENAWLFWSEDRAHVLLEVPRGDAEQLERLAKQRPPPEPTKEVLALVKKTYLTKQEPRFEPDSSHGFIFRVVIRKSKLLGWATMNGREVWFYNKKGAKVVLRLPQEHCPALCHGKRDVMAELVRVYGLKRFDVRIKALLKPARFCYKCVTATRKRADEQLIGRCNIVDDYFLFFDRDGQRLVYAVERDAMPTRKAYWQTYGDKNVDAVKKRLAADKRIEGALSDAIIE